MNIKDAKKQIENAINSYLAKDKYGEYRIPSEKTAPVFLFGAPGIGKTAIMEQLSKELGIGLVSYSMTHHTRQSAIGLPMIVKKDFGGSQYAVSEYTMSEIIASIYEYMEKTGIREGILFLDEINCVSETLAPSMLQFLQ
jgi:MoxR-like ATPase